MVGLSAPSKTLGCGQLRIKFSNPSVVWHLSKSLLIYNGAMKGKLHFFVSLFWLPVFLLIFDFSPIFWLLRVEPNQFSRGTMMIAIIILFSGWIPLLLKPNRITRQAAIFAIFLSVMVWLPPFKSDMQNILSIPADQFSFSPLWRLFNAILLFPASFSLIMHFVSDRLPKRYIAGILFLYLHAILFCLSIFLLPPGYGRNVLRQIILFWMFTIMVLDVAVLIRTIRNSDVNNLHQSQQLRSLLFFILLVLIPAFLRFIGFLFAITIFRYEWLMVSLIALPIGVTYVTIRHNLFGIDALIRRATGYTIISILALLFFLLIGLGIGQNAAIRVPDYQWGAIFLSLLIFSAIFSPIQKRIQLLIDRWFYPERFIFTQHIQYIQQEITKIIHPKEIEYWMEAELPERIGAKWAVWVPGALPKIPDHAEQEHGWSSLLSVEDRVLGGFWLGVRHSGLPYNKEEQLQLSVLIKQAALAMAYAQALNTVEEINLNLEKRVAERTTQVLEQEQSLAVLSERRRIARDIHDSISQTLFSINLGARAIRKLAATDSQTAAQELKVLEKSAQNAQQEMRVLLNQLREPPPIEKQTVINLIKLLQEHIQLLSNQNGPDGSPPLLSIKYSGPDELWLPKHTADTLLQILREAFHNIIKHAGVREAFCQLNKTIDKIYFEIEDHGKGFSPLNPTHPSSMGLDNIQERISLLRGHLEIESWPEQGTTLKISIPWEEQR